MLDLFPYGSSMCRQVIPKRLIKHIRGRFIYAVLIIYFVKFAVYLRHFPCHSANNICTRYFELLLGYMYWTAPHHVLNYVIRKSRNCSSTLLFKFDFFRLRSMCERFRSIFVASTEKDILHHVMSQSIQIDNCLCYPEDTRHGYTTYMLYSPVYSKANGSASAKGLFFKKQRSTTTG